ncbi:MAG: YceI family protein [bacterium]|nr:YceI family protein [bacterium]
MATWKIDSAHSNANFVVRHMMITNVRGSFKEVSGTIEYDPANPAAASVEATINAASIETGVADRDNHLRSADFFDVANTPNITFKSTNVEPTGEGTAKVTGDLTIRDVTRPVTLDVEFTGQSANPWTKAATAGFSATGKINREEFGLTWNQALEAGGWLVGKDIKLELDVEAVQVVEAETA